MKRKTINFLKISNKLNIVSCILILIGLGSIYYKGLQPSLDFTGGQTIRAHYLDKNLSEEVIKTYLGNEIETEIVVSSIKHKDKSEYINYNSFLL